MVYGKYDKGKETRQKIIVVAKELFYEKGFNQTSITEICKVADVMHGTFTYYFKTKVDLVSEIYADLLTKCYQIVRSNSTEYMDTFQMNLTANQFYYTVIFSSPENARFYHEVLLKMSVFDYIGRHVKRLYQSYNFHYNLNLSEEDLRDVLLVDSGIRREFFTDMFNTYGYKLEPEIVSKFIRKMNIHLGRTLTLDADIVLSYIERAEQLIKATDFSHLSLF